MGMASTMDNPDERWSDVDVGRTENAVTEAVADEGNAARISICDSSDSYCMHTLYKHTY